MKRIRLRLSPAVESLLFVGSRFGFCDAVLDDFDFFDGTTAVDFRFPMPMARRLKQAVPPNP